MANYTRARVGFLADLGVNASNRDPLAEFSERFVAALLGGRLAESRVQKGYDLVDRDGQFVQVRYLANPSERWVNEHVVSFLDGLDSYALMIFEDLMPTGVVVFSRRNLAAVGAALGKRHPDQARTLQLTWANWRALKSGRTDLALLGVRVFLPPWA